MTKSTFTSSPHRQFGYIYETSVAGPRRKSGNGQFFTPVNVCDLMAAVVDGKYDGNETVCDPFSGNRRVFPTLRAAKASARKEHGTVTIFRFRPGEGSTIVASVSGLDVLP